MLDFNLPKKYNTSKAKIFRKVAVEVERGRPKAIIKRDVQLNLKLTKFEAEKISKIAEKKNITKTDAILQGIDLLINHKPKRYRNLSGIAPKYSEGVIEGETIMFYKK